MCQMDVFLGFLGAVLMIRPAIAGTASFEVRGILHDRSEQSIETAPNEAVEAGVRAAVGVGFSWIRLKPPLVSDDSVTIEILATDADPVRRRGEGKATWTSLRLPSGRAGSSCAGSPCSRTIPPTEEHNRWDYSLGAFPQTSIW